MSPVSTVLRALARIIETAPDENTWRTRTPSRYICVNLKGSRRRTILSGFTDAERDAAAQYLHFLGMGKGMDEFSYYSHELALAPANHAERQLLRRHWLTAAAYFWDEGVRP